MCQKTLGGVVFCIEAFGRWSEIVWQGLDYYKSERTVGLIVKESETNRNEAASTVRRVGIIEKSQSIWFAIHMRLSNS